VTTGEGGLDTAPSSSTSGWSWDANVPPVSQRDVIANYAADGMVAAVLDASRAHAGGHPLGVQHLAAFDQFHLGGPVATSWVADALGVGPEASLLDVGAGIGGPARQLAAATGAQVTGVDLTPRHVDDATALSRAVGLHRDTVFVLGDATRLPFGTAAFDAAYLLFVGMNVEDKPALFAEVRRVVQDGGRFVVYDPVRTGDAQPTFPLPWAGSAGTSHLATAEEYAAGLEAAGFTVESQRDCSADVVRLAEQQDSDLTGRIEIGRLQYGDEAPVRFGNLVRAIREGLVQPRMFVVRTR
jgi:SAM-dependent methyltransferase